ncbi:MAG: protein kinase [Gemmatimonadetes bacterium]|nr:protein kinase [Gemmatimonadota bacterium]
MLELATFGGVAVLRDGVVIPWTLRGWQRAALLALLAGVGKRGIDRLALASTLWPESPEAAARHSLDELLSRTRRELGERELFVGSMQVALNAAVITADVQQFATDVAASRLEAAAQRYHGPFADGLRTADSATLETRITALRAQFAGDFRRVAETLASAAARRSEFSVAARWWERVVAADPESTTALRAYVEMLAASGDRGRALGVARARIKRDALEGRDADVTLTQWVERLTASGARVMPVGTTPTPTVDSRREGVLARALGAEIRVGRLRGEGSLEATWQGTAVATGAQVELHLIQPRVAAGIDPACFLEVMGRAMQVSHPGVLPTLDARATHDALVTVTAVRPDDTLKQRLRTGVGPIAEVLDVGLQLAHALDALHAAQLVHGLLRPRLVALAHNAPLVCSVGLGQVLMGRRGIEDRSTVVSIGKPRYQGPEQLAGTVPLGAWSDVYALGAILYEWLGGAPAFPETADGALRKMAEPPPSLRATRRTVPVALDNLVCACMAPHAADRPAHMREVVQGLSSIG